MANFNVQGAKAAEETTVVVNRPVEPGYQNLTVLSIADVTASTGTTGLEIEFQSDKPNTYPFKQKFWLNNVDGSVNGGMPSFLYLVEAFTGAELPETATNTQAITALLVGKTVDGTVGGERYTQEKDGKTYNNIRPQLPFGSWKGERTPYIRGSWDESATQTSDSPNNTENTEKKTDDVPW